MNQILPVWEVVKQGLRDWLGPIPQSYYILPDGRVLPSTFTLPEYIQPDVYVFHPLTKRIIKFANVEQGRFKPLPFIGIVIKSRSLEIDISEWLGEIRAFPVPECMNAKQILLLWSYAHNQYISFADATMHIVKDDGTEETIEV